MFRKVVLGLIITLLGLGLWQYELVGYGIMQAKGQIRVISEAKPIHDFLEDPSFPDSLKAKLRLIEEIKDYAVNQLGINDGGSYETLFDQQGKVILWNLTASKPFALEAKNWSFPVIGSFPYKGFFDLEKAKVERDQLKAEGYDTRIRPVNGWSTLGWFDDPILSNMLNRSEGQLAELIIHELTHGTVFVKDSIEYNENLATFIGEMGARKFLTEKYGSDSFEYKDYVNGESDFDQFIQHFIRGANVLDSLYQSLDPSLDRETKSKEKQECIENIVQNLDTISFQDQQRYTGRFDRQLPNNAYFMSFMRYHSKQDTFMEEYERQFDKDLKSYLTFLKQKYPSL